MRVGPETEVAVPAKPVVLHLVGGNNAQGGMLSYVRQLVREDLPGFEQRVWKYRGYPPENEKFVCLGRARVLDVNIRTDLKGAALDLLPLYRWLRKNPKTILYAHNRPNAILGAIMHIICGVPVLVHVHTLGRKKILNRLLWRMANATVIYNSTLSCRHFGHAIETAHIHTPTIRWPERPDSGEGSLVACGAIVQVKNIDLIIEAFNAAGEAAPRSLHIYGLSSDPFEPAYQRRIIDMAKQNPRIHLHNWDERWTDHLGYNDIFMHARCMEPFGIVLLEAFAKGCRMVVPHHTFLDDLSHDGIFFADLTPESLAECLRRANTYKPPSHLWESRRACEKQFAIETTLERLHAVLCSVVRGNPRFTGVKELSQRPL
jgi:glycosyltransferase involved in cell wall biosynthesis